MRWARYSKKPIDPLDELPHLDGQLCLIDGPDWNAQRHAPEELKTEVPAPTSVRVKSRRSPTPIPGIITTDSSGEKTFRQLGKLKTSAEFAADREAQLKGQQR